jgi:hypothetical protein
MASSPATQLSRCHFTEHALPKAALTFVLFTVHRSILCAGCIGFGAHSKRMTAMQPASAGVADEH